MTNPLMPRPYYDGPVLSHLGDARFTARMRKVIAGENPVKSGKIRQRPAKSANPRPRRSKSMETPPTPWQLRLTKQRRCRGRFCVIAAIRGSGRWAAEL
jgi:hypothetical protein